ncbi:MAG TPA: hypothetical protein VLC09_22090, partial [Polyangiaceae bacterium]|nr:hypothetical protein [Polyangiaceae bacterium]
PVLGLACLPPLVTLVTLLASSLVARTVLRTACRQLGARGRDAEARLLGRASLVTTLLPASATSLLVLGSYAFAEPRFGAKAGLQWAFTTAAVSSSVLVVFARAAAAHIHGLASSRGAALAAPHPASLAGVVAASFGRSLITTASYGAAFAIGQAALLAFSVSLGGETPESALLYPHLLLWLSLGSLVFGGLVVRSSERESGAWAWTRAALVSVSLFVAGAWSLAQSLDDGHLARLLPATVSFCFVAAPLGLAPLWLGRRSSRSRELAAGALLLSLCVVGLGVFELSTSETPIPNALLHALVLATLLALAGIAQSWRVALEMSRAADAGHDLVTEQVVQRSNDGAPPDALVGPQALVLVMVGLVVLQVLPGESTAAGPLGLGATLGALLLVAAIHGSVRAAAPARLRVARFLDEHQQRNAAASASFGEVLELSRIDRLRGFAPTLLLILGLPLGLIALGRFPHPTLLPSATLGLMVGALGCAALFGFVLAPVEPTELEGHANLAPPLALSLLACLCAGLQFF